MQAEEEVQDDRLIANMIRKRVARYRANYTAVFLQSATHKYAPAQTLQMVAYMEAQCEKIRRGEADDANTEPDLLPRKRERVTYRPGLTLLLRDAPSGTDPPGAGRADRSGRAESAGGDGRGTA